MTMQFYLFICLTLTFSLLVTTIMHCYYSGQGNFLITKGPILVYKFCQIRLMTFSSNVVEFFNFLELSC